MITGHNGRLKHRCIRLWCWRNVSRVPSVARISNRSILIEGQHDFLLVNLILDLKFKYSDGKARLIRDDTMLTKTEGQRIQSQPGARWLHGVIETLNITLVVFSVV